MELTEIRADDIVIPKKFIKSELNPVIWDKGKDFYSLKSEVREKLLEIAQKFYESLEIDTIYDDIYFVGSMASYNWTEQSDIDLHLLLDYSKVNKNTDLVEKYFDVKKRYWNDNHEIKIHGFDVELGCQDKTVELHSKAVFSIKDNKWLSKPDNDSFLIDKQALKTKIAGLVSQIEKLEKIKENEKTIQVASKIKDRLKKMRKSGLEKGGEFSIENLAFKYLRNHGYIGKVMNIKRDATDKKLSL
jgi:hypothetical protein